MDERGLAGNGKLVPMHVTTTINLVCRNPRHGHDARLVSRFNDRVNGEWKPLPAFKRPIGEDFALIWDETGDMHLRYKFPCGAELTQERLHAELDKARALGNPEITLG